MMCNLGEGIEERTAARVTKEVTKKVTKEVTKELNAKHAKHAKELTEKLAEKDRIISAYQLLAKHTPIAQIAAETGLSEEAIRALQSTLNPNTNPCQLSLWTALAGILMIYASNEPKSVLARDLGDCRDNLRNSRSVFLIVEYLFHEYFFQMPDISDVLFNGSI